jgi:ech hydrogenase subunit D
MTEYRMIDVAGVLAMAMERRGLGDRLVQMHCSHGENWEIVYSFDGPQGFVHYRVLSKEKPELKSISDFFPSAYLYENEISELFGLKIEGMSIDFKGMLYNPQRKAPFNLAACESCSTGIPAQTEKGNRVSPGTKAMVEEVAALSAVAAAAMPAAKEPGDV